MVWHPTGDTELEDLQRSPEGRQGHVESFSIAIRVGASHLRNDQPSSRFN